MKHYAIIVGLIVITPFLSASENKENTLAKPHKKNIKLPFNVGFTNDLYEKKKKSKPEDDYAGRMTPRPLTAREEFQESLKRLLCCVICKKDYDELE
ncbi:MAG: hypothetical protein ACOYT8_05130 [Candidatus Dependentiae bacterium]